MTFRNLDLFLHSLSVCELHRPSEQGEYDEETVYGNIQHQQLGAMGNAGERWESYWKTNTLLRTDDQPQSPKK